MLNINDSNVTITDENIDEAKFKSLEDLDIYQLFQKCVQGLYLGKN